MPRRKRDCADGAIYHVFARGNRRQAVFRDDEDRAWFLGRLEAVGRATAAIHIAHCLMTNHIHLVTCPGPRGISHLMLRVLGAYAQWFNRRHGTVGHLFQGRFGSRLIDSERDLLLVVRYVHRNPVEARMVATAEGWRWSSHAGHLEPEPSAFLLQGVRLVRQAVGGDSRRAIGLFKALVDREVIPDEPAFHPDGGGQDGRCRGKESREVESSRPGHSLSDVSTMMEHRFHLPAGCLAGRRRDGPAREARRAFCRFSTRNLGMGVSVVAALLGRAPSTVSEIVRDAEERRRESETEGTVPAAALRGIRNRRERPRRSTQRRILARVGG